MPVGIKAETKHSQSSPLKLDSSCVKKCHDRIIVYGAGTGQQTNLSSESSKCSHSFEIFFMHENFAALKQLDGCVSKSSCLQFNVFTVVSGLLRAFCGITHKQTHTPR